MTLDETIIYKELKEHLNSFPIGYPSTKSGVEMDLLKYFFTPEEARIATKLRFSWYRDLEPLETIYEHTKDLGLSIEELESHLDTMAKKGTIHFKKENGKKYYSNAQFVIGMYEFQVNNLNKDFLDKFHKYLGIGFGLEVFGTKISQFRTIPVEKSITPEHAISTYDDLKTIIKEISKVNIKKCIGCGNCVPTCPEEAIQLKKKDKEIDLSATMDDLYDKILERKLELKGKK